ncbi:MAG: FAD-dependent thymidylate synthase [Rhodobacteraceae bacterium]|nr:FAD-dependent thymidylate synthase [Paracoccaceae bacterium]MCY4251477.1 FAD-dependent thymidylate synthase [Paracoccaceae bacterium]MCY4308849.1 FAD-dependent thymidylate synthase [Paracoccaceae bacterium]
MTITPEILKQIEEQRNSSQTSLRETSPGMEKNLYTLFPILDHGFIRIVDYMGNDSSVVQAARVSYGKGTKKARSDEGLIRYLMRHRHTTPFEMCEIKFHVKLPIFVARQWIRHRTASVNEYSARYSKLEDEFYIPEFENLSAQSGVNRQGRGEILPSKEGKRVRDILRQDSHTSYENYEKMLSQENQEGLSRELARINLPTNVYTQWYWKVNLLNLLKFIHLRIDPHAQYEIRVYAEKLAEIVADWVPMTHQAFVDYWLEGISLSKQQIELLKRKMNGEQITFEATGLSKREWNEFTQALDLEIS